MNRACSLRIEGSRLAPHQEGWALEALKYAGSYVPPTSLALFSLHRTEVQLRKVSPNDPFSRAFRRRSPPREERPLASKGGVEAKRALSGAIRLPVRPTRSLPCPEGHLALEPALRSPPTGLPPRLPQRPKTTRSRNWRRISPQIAARRTQPAHFTALDRGRMPLTGGVKPTEPETSVRDARTA